MSGCAGHRISSPFTFISYLSIGVQQSGSIIEEGDLHLRRHGRAREPGYRAGPADARKGPGDRIFVRGSGAGTGEGPDPQGGIRLPHRPHLQLPPVLQASGDPAQPGLCGEPPSGARRGPGHSAAVPAGRGHRNGGIRQLPYGEGRCQGGDPHGRSRVQHGARPHHGDAGALRGPDHGGV